jgi:uncharacterized protein YqgV (UPF0045/DUF77 family)
MDPMVTAIRLHMDMATAIHHRMDPMVTAIRLHMDMATAIHHRMDPMVTAIRLHMDMVMAIVTSMAHHAMDAAPILILVTQIMVTVVVIRRMDTAVAVHSLLTVTAIPRIMKSIVTRPIIRHQTMATITEDMAGDNPATINTVS